MNFFDANCIIGTPPQETPYKYETPEMLLKSMDNLKIDKAIVSSFKDICGSGWTDLSVKKEFLDSIKKYRDRLIPCLSINTAGISLDYDDSRYIEDLLSEGVRNFKFIIDPNKASLGWCLDRIAEQLIASNSTLFVDLLSSGGNISHLPATPQSWNYLFCFAQANPKLKMVIFSPKMTVQQHYCISLARHCDNVNFDISGFQYWCGLKSLTKRFGADRLIFGSYAPYFEQAQFMLEIIYSDIPTDEKEKIAWQNLSSLSGIKF